jgi:hypothetical protein
MTHQLAMTHALSSLEWAELATTNVDVGVLNLRCGARSWAMLPMHLGVQGCEEALCVAEGQELQTTWHAG